MGTDFLVVALSEHEFKPFFRMSDNELREFGASIIEVDSCPGYPCRVTLEDADVGERVLAISYTHHDVQSAYKSSGPIFVREYSKQASLKVNQIPSMLLHRELSVRSFDSNAMMVAADIVFGEQLAQSLQTQFANHSVDYVHVHNVKPGCFNCSVVRQ